MEAQEWFNKLQRVESSSILVILNSRLTAPLAGTWYKVKAEVIKTPKRALFKGDYVLLDDQRAPRFVVGDVF